MNKGTILIVDNHENHRLLYSDCFSHKGYGVVAASTGKEALKAYKGIQPTPSCVVLDLRLPDMSGLDLMDEILKVNHGVPIVINTTCSPDRAGSRASHADGYVVKSSNLGELTETVEKAIKSRKRD